jgi:putative transposase
VKYAFIDQHAGHHPAKMMCQVMGVHPSGYYAWRKQPLSDRAKDNQRLLGLIKQSWLESGCVYGYRKVYDDMMDLNETCSENRVQRLMHNEGLKAQVGYKKHRYMKGGEPAVVAPNHLQRQFDVKTPNNTWVTDITYIRTYEGWLYLAVVVDLFSRRVIGWSMQSRMHVDLVMSALLMAIWHRKPTNEVFIHSDQGSQYTSTDWQRFLKDHNLICSMSRRGNCHDNAVAESFFQLLKRERVKRKIYKTREDARSDIFDYIEMFFNPKRKHGYNGNLSPAEFEKRYFVKLGTV